MSPGPTVRKGQMIDEQWLPVVSKGGIFADRYEVSNLGRVRANLWARRRRVIPGWVLSQKKRRDGYLEVRLVHVAWARVCISVHRLVAEAFIGERPDGYHVNHIDGVRTNNMVDNLEFLSCRENIRHAARVIDGRSHIVFGGERMSITEAIDRYGVVGMSPVTVRSRIKKYGWSVEHAITTPVQRGRKEPRDNESERDDDQ